MGRVSGSLVVVEDRVEKRSGFAGQLRAILPERVVSKATREQPLLRGLIAAGAGYFPKAAGHLRRRSDGAAEAILIYCVKGGGWCEIGGSLHTIRKGDLLVLPPRVPHTYGAHVSSPWTIHWAHAAGANVPEYLRQLRTTAESPFRSLGEDLQLSLLFNEVFKALERGSGFFNLLNASHALAHLLALAISHQQERRREASAAVARIGQSIRYMSENIDEPLRITRLASLANLSSAHFSTLFKEQMGCSPRDYLLLRIHKACQLLQDSTLSVKEIARRLGYQDQFHFSRQFKALRAVSPSEYRAGPLEARGD